MRGVIAIDGPAGAGKSSTARKVAAALGYRYLDTGALYRALALSVIRAGAAEEGPERMTAIARGARVRAEWRGADEMGVFLDGEEVTRAIRDPEVTRLVSPLSAIPEVRELLIVLQREAAAAGGLVAEGRDIGTVVFPDAPLKIFLVADARERARRRRLELEAAGIRKDEKEILREIEERDRRDSGRATAPLRRAPDAVVVDTTGLSLEGQVERIVALAREAGLS
ncbi:MAG: (d)CMP kinase [Candidatus Eisenbacteria bacterium]|nr:(d)CMP kinase [Candidatus Eisenbacteria bacterium]